MRKKYWILVFCLMGELLCAAPRHSRSMFSLPPKEKEFAQQLSTRQRRIFCGRFSHAQRESAIKYAAGRGKDSCYTPDEAVLKVMEETGMSLAVKGRRE